MAETGRKPRFAQTYCSHCGGAFGPGDHGYSHCEDHVNISPDAARELFRALSECVEQLDHIVPGDCYATGPSTGNDYADFVVCPGCEALKTARTALARARGQDNGDQS